MAAEEPISEVLAEHIGARVIGQRTQARRRKAQRVRLSVMTSAPTIAAVTASAMAFNGVPRARIIAFAAPMALAGVLAATAAWHRRGSRFAEGPHPIDRLVAFPIGLSMLVLPFLIGGFNIAADQGEPMVAALVCMSCFVAIQGIQYRRQFRRYALQLAGFGGLYAVVFAAAGHFAIALLTVVWISNLIATLRYAVSIRNDLADLTDDHLAMTHLDALTGALNRDGLLATWERTQLVEQQSLFMFDFDGFSLANDRFGYAAADEILIEAAHRLQHHLNDFGAVARLGADRFAVLVEGDDASRAADKAIAAASANLADAYKVADESISFAVSVGAVRCTPQMDLASALTNADYATAIAKQAEGPKIIYFDPGMRQSLDARRRRERQLRAALAEGSFTWWGQPIVDAITLEPVAVEMLCRLPTNDGLKLPGDFLDTLEEMGALAELGQRNLSAAAAWLKRWRNDHDLGHIVVNVNVTAGHLAATASDDITAAIESEDLSRLCLELVEHDSLPQTSATQARVEDLQALGVSLSIDDFGSGYSALSLLSEFPITGIKIDRSIVDGVDHDETKRALVGAVTSLAGSLQIRTVAEGVESLRQLEALRDLGVSYVQGWLIGRAAPVDQLTEQLRRLRQNAQSGADDANERIARRHLRQIRPNEEATWKHRTRSSTPRPTSPSSTRSTGHSG